MIYECTKAECLETIASTELKLSEIQLSSDTDAQLHPQARNLNQLQKLPVLTDF